MTMAVQQTTPTQISQDSNAILTVGNKVVSPPIDVAFSGLKIDVVMANISPHKLMVVKAIEQWTPYEKQDASKIPMVIVVSMDKQLLVKTGSALALLRSKGLTNHLAVASEVVSRIKNDDMVLDKGSITSKIMMVAVKISPPSQVYTAEEFMTSDPLLYAVYTEKTPDHMLVYASSPPSLQAAEMVNDSTPAEVQSLVYVAPPVLAAETSYQMKTHRLSVDVVGHIFTT
ncbi:MAG: hypothetical protein PHN39_03345 [Candidatus Pacebacteria bacterium]|nr:hypothetical protein [Candidatus Paceibacterota bacterium]